LTGLVRNFRHSEFAPRDLIEAKGDRRISVCLPARNEVGTVGRIVSTIRRDLVVRWPLVDEIVVVDDGSSDGTARVASDSGARVVDARNVLTEWGSGHGKGEALWKSLKETTSDIMVWCDADVRNFDHRFVTGLLGPILLNDDVVFVKGHYHRPLDGAVGEGGRVTELVARPLISLMFPHLVPIIQPLAGECAGRRDALMQVPFVRGYGVDLALLIDVSAMFGLGSIAQVDLGVRVHRNRPLDELRAQALDVLQAALSRAEIAGPDAARELPALAKLLEVPTMGQE